MYLQHFNGDGFHSLVVEVDVLVEQLHEELGFGGGVHAVGGDLDTLLQAVENSLLVTKLEKKISRRKLVNDAMKPDSLLFPRCYWSCPTRRAASRP